MTRKTATFKQLLEYINEPKEKGKTPILFNLENIDDDLESISKEFEINSEFRKQKGSSRNILYHEILSFSEEDKKHLTLEIIQDLCMKYLELRSPNCLAYAKVHGDTKNPHIHLMISSNEYLKSKQHWISKQRFKQIKQELEFYQIEKYPKLTQSLPTTRKSPQRHSSNDKEVQMKKRGEIPTKEKLKFFVLDFLDKSKNLSEYNDQLDKYDLKEYTRSEKPYGIIDLNTQKKYRYKTLGIQDEFEKFQSRLNRQKELQSIQEKKLVQQIKAESFQEDILNIIENKPIKLKSKKEIRRERESKSIRRKMNRLKRREKKRLLGLPSL